MTACWKQYAIVKDGTLYSAALYSALATILGSTYGGNGLTTFGVPDERSRFRLAWDNSGTANRVTSAGSGISGITLGASGGNELIQSHTHTGTIGGSQTVQANNGSILGRVEGPAISLKCRHLR
jgi:microcystin-dependent protein